MKQPTDINIISVDPTQVDAQPPLGDSILSRDHSMSTKLPKLIIPDHEVCEYCFAPDANGLLPVETLPHSDVKIHRMLHPVAGATYVPCRKNSSVIAESHSQWHEAFLDTPAAQS
jgi:hypothetical protein